MAAVSQHPEAHRFVQWQADWLFDYRHDRRDIRVFVDQKWCNLSQTRRDAGDSIEVYELWWYRHEVGCD